MFVCLCVVLEYRYCQCEFVCCCVRVYRYLSVCVVLEYRYCQCEFVCVCVRV